MIKTQKLKVPAKVTGLIDQKLHELIYMLPVFLKFFYGMTPVRTPKYSSENEFKLVFSPRRNLIGVPADINLNCIQCSVERYFKKMLLGQYYSIGKRFLNTYGVRSVNQGVTTMHLYDVDYILFKLILEVEYFLANEGKLDVIFDEKTLPEDIFRAIYMEFRKCRAYSPTEMVTEVVNLIIKNSYKKSGVQERRFAESSSYGSGDIDRDLYLPGDYYDRKVIEKLAGHLIRNVEGIFLEILIDMPKVQIYLDESASSGLAEDLYSSYKKSYCAEGFEETGLLPKDDAVHSDVYEDDVDDVDDEDYEDYEDDVWPDEVDEVDDINEEDAERMYLMSDFLDIDSEDEVLMMGAKSMDELMVSDSQEGYVSPEDSPFSISELLNILKSVGGRPELEGFIPGAADQIRQYIMDKLQIIPVDPLNSLRVAILRGVMHEEISYRRLDYRRAVSPRQGLVGVRIDMLKPKITWVLDTSGSMSDRELMMAMNVIYSSINLNKYSRVIQFDTNITQDDYIDISDPESVDKIKTTSGRGGTQFNPVIDLLKDDDSDIIVIITDGYFCDGHNLQLTNSTFKGTPVVIFTDSYTDAYIDQDVVKIKGFFDIVKQHMAII